MTSLVAWIGVDSRKPASLYIATDSRVTWPASRSDDGRPLPARIWDEARKTVASTSTANIFGFVGDVVHPALALNTVAALLEAAKAPSSLAGSFEQFQGLVEQAWKTVPPADRRATELVHGTRVGEGFESVFGVQVLARQQGEVAWTATPLPTPERSAALRFSGSGRGHAERHSRLWTEPAVEDARLDLGGTRSRTSRAVFSGFCDALEAGQDAQTGGSPQLVGLYRQGFGRQFGVAWRGASYLAGTRLHQTDFPTLEWRNRFFERCGPTGVLLEKAQKHAEGPI
jgi:hypothetical protein